jgi:hypothetical protein
MIHTRAATDGSTTQSFPTHPGLDYALAIGIPVALLGIYGVFQAFYCFHTAAGLESAFCEYHHESNSQTAGHHGAAMHAGPVLVAALGLVLLLIYAPFFLGAVLIALRAGVRRDITGVAYWLVAWVAIGLGPVAVSLVAAYIQEIIQSYRYDFAFPGAQALHRLAGDRQGWAMALGAHGAITGIIYCALAVTRRNHPSVP